MDNTKKDLLSETHALQTQDGRKVNKPGQESSEALTCRHRTNQDSVEFDDWAENVLGVSSAGLVLAVELEDEPLVLLLHQHQDVFQEDGVEL